MKVTSLRSLVSQINQDLGVFCEEFAKTRKQLAALKRTPSKKKLFKYDNDNRDWCINEGGHTEIQYHIYLRGNEIGYGLGFNSWYTPYYNEMTPVDYIRPFAESFLILKSSCFHKWSSTGMRWIDDEGGEEVLKNISVNHYVLFGRKIQIVDEEIDDSAYSQMIKDIKIVLFDMYKEIFGNVQYIKNCEKMNEKRVSVCKEILLNNKNLILTGAPGTGKTYLAKQIAQQLIFGEVKENLIDDEPKQFDEQCGFVQFHPSYDYTDFVEGLRPIQDDNGNVGFERKDGVFKEFCINALKNPNKNYVFIIDEINRGEISKIFGELFFSIDPGYRGENGKVRTQYANMQTVPNDFDDKLGITDDNNFGHFFVPKNVYIIGTMNDIDRSVESMDFAFRRRFAFKEIKADDSMKMLDDEKAWEDEQKEIVKPSQDSLEKLKNRMTNLNNMIWHEAKTDEKEEEKCIEGLSSAYHIGAAYFLKLKNYLGDTDGGFENLWNNHLEGLLREYLRGSLNIEENIAKLKAAYNNESPENIG